MRPNFIGRFECAFYDGHEMTFWQQLFFLPLLACIIIRDICEMVRDWRERSPKRR